jgi:hypothetical protein
LAGEFVVIAWRIVVRKRLIPSVENMQHFENNSVEKICVAAAQVIA